MHCRSLPFVLAAVALGCGPDSAGVEPELPLEGIRAIHITRNGVPVGAVIQAGALGGYPFDVVLEDEAGVIQPREDQRVTWGSTHPAIVDGGDSPGSTFLFFQRNGTARVIAHLDGLRDTVTIEIEQVAVMAQLMIDTVVTLSPDALDVSGAPNAYHGLRFAVVRRDSNYHRATSSDPIRFEGGDDPPFEVIAEPRDTITILGTRAGAGSLIIGFRETEDTVPVHVADRYAVLRLIETGSTTRHYTRPDTVRIPAGAAVIFQNETRGFIGFDGVDGVIPRSTDAEPSPSGPVQPTVNGRLQTGNVQWHVGPIPSNGREAQRFTSPGTYEFWWAGQPRTVIVTP